jgi:hypothetical protein
VLAARESLPTAVLFVPVVLLVKLYNPTVLQEAVVLAERD